MKAIHEQLQETIQTLHRRAIDADQSLDRLQQAQQGKFQAIFADDSGFTTSSKRFSPYVQEVASDWQAIKAMPDDEAKSALPSLIRKIELMLTTLNQFQQTLRQG